MSRSRSSFDVEGAIATATSLSSAEEDATSPYRNVPLVSFGNTPSVAPPSPDLPPPSVRGRALKEGAEPPSIEEGAGEASAARRPPKLPDLSNEPNPVIRCERIIDWIGEATGASDVFIADAAGMPIAGAIEGAEARLAGAGVVASSITQLAAAIPGKASSLFELHIGEGPFFQLVGFEIKNALYLVGLTRATPLTYRQAHAIRLAVRHALGETLPVAAGHVDPAHPRSPAPGGPGPHDGGLYAPSRGGSA